MRSSKAKYNMENGGSPGKGYVWEQGFILDLGDNGGTFKSL